MKITQMSFDKLHPTKFSAADRRVMAIQIRSTVEETLEQTQAKVARKKRSKFFGMLEKIGVGLGAIAALGLLTASFGTFVGPTVAAVAATTAAVMDHVDQLDRGQISYYDTKTDFQATYSVDDIRQALQEIDAKNKVYDTSNQVKNTLNGCSLDQLCFVSSKPESRRAR